MNKKILCGVAASMLAAGVAVFNLNLALDDDSKINLALINAEVLASNEENGGNSHSLQCSGTIGWCTGKCNIHQVEMGKTGRDDTVVFTCHG